MKRSIAHSMQVIILILFSTVFGYSATFTVSNTNDSGAGSLRQAILDANANANSPTVDDIVFSTTGTLTLSSNLPAITEDLTITGSVGYIIDGANFKVFTLSNADNVTIQNLDMSMGTNDAIVINGSSNINILNNNMSGHRRTVVATNTSGLAITDNNIQNTSQSNLFSFTLNGVTGLSASGNDWTGSPRGMSLANMDGITIDNIAGAGTEIVIDNALDGFSDVNINFELINVTNSTIQNLDMSGGTSDAISINGGGNINILNNNMSGHRRTVIATNTAGLAITDNNIQNTGNSNLWSIDLNGVTDLSATGNEWAGNGRGISLTNMDDIDVDSVVGPSTEIVISNALDGFGQLDRQLQFVNTTASSVSNLILEDGSTAIGVISSEVDVSAVSIDDYNYGLQITNASTGNITCSTFTNISTDAIRVSGISSAQNIEDNTFGCINGFAVNNTTNPEVAMLAENNFWEDASGPSNDGGSGESYNGDVDAAPFLMAVDACAPDGQEACAALIPNSAPIANCMDLTVSADGNCEGMVSAEDFDNDTTPSNDPDNDPLIFTVDPEGPYALGETPVIVTVSDGELSSTCTATITVVDDEDPIFTCDGDPLNYLETFPINGKGVAGGCSNSAPTSCASVNLSGVDWVLGGNFNTALNDGGDFLLTQGNRFLFQDSNSPTYWQTPVIATAPGGVVDISVDVEYNIIGFVRDEYVNVAYSIDGGSFVSFPNVVGTGGVFTIHPGPGEGDISGTITASQTGIASGSSLIVRITSKNTNTSRRVFIDNVLVNGTGTNTIAVNNDPGLCGATIALVAPDVLDNCDLSLVVTNDAPAFFPVGTTDVVWTATDDDENSTTCLQQVIVSDSEVPVAPTLSTLTGDCEVVVIPPTTTDNCTATVTGTTTDPLVYSTPGNYTITWLFDDGNNNVNTITQQVVVNELPIELDCPSSDNLSACSSEADIEAAYNLWAAGFEVSGGCNTQSNIADIPSLPEYNCGEGINLSFTLIATDDNGSTSCASTFNVTAADPLTVNCPTNESIGPCLSQSEVDDAFALWLADFDFSDGCNATATDLTGTTAPSSDGGVINITYTATDDCGASETCSASFEVLADTTDPTITCPAPVTQTADAGLCEATSVDLGMPTYDDNCPGAMVSNDAPATFPVGETTVIWTVIDASDNEVTCTQLVTITDDEDPTIICPDDITVSADAGICGAVVSIMEPSVSDNCSVLSLGNAVNFDGINDFSQIAASSTINTSNHSTRTIETYFKVDDKSINTRRQMIWEEGGATNGMNLYVFDGKLYYGIFSNSTGWSGVWLTTNLIESGQWHNAVLVYDGTISTGRLKAYLDGNLVASADASSVLGTVLAAHPDANSIGNLNGHTTFHDGAVTTESGLHPFDGDIDEIRLWTVARTEAELEATNTVQLVGNEAGLALYYPMDQGTACADNSGINFLDDITATNLDASMTGFNLDGSTGCSSNWTMGAPVLNSEILLTNDYTGTASASSTYPAGVTTVEYTAEDAAGNESSCTFTITVEDDEDPMAVCYDITVQLDVDNMASIVAADIDGGSTDNCGIQSIEITDGQTSYTCDDVGQTYSVTLTVIDDSDNESTCIAMVTIADTDNPCCDAPMAMCEDVTVSFDGNSSILLTPADVDAGSTADCGLQSITVSPNEFFCADYVGSNFTVTDVNVTLTIEDINGEVSSCVATVSIINDDDPPVFECPGNETLFNDPGQCGAVFTYEVTASDACSNANIVQTEGLPSGSVFPVGVTTNTFEASDQDNNVSVCSFTVTVVDNEPPVASCQDITVELGAAGAGSISDSEISGVINTYASVSAIGADNVTVASAAGFSANDKVIIMQMNGADIDLSNSASFGDVTAINNAGNYEYARIASVAGTTMNFISALERSYDASAVVQVIRVPEYDNVTITGTLTAADWNGSIGGVLAFDAEGTVTMNAGIDMDGKGFRGGLRSGNYYAGCQNFTDYFHPSPSIRAGDKGEGISDQGSAFKAGRGKLVNGGGGGGSVNSGGGGGANYGAGGQGGREWEGCNQPLGGLGGADLALHIASNRLFLGGAGGGGQQNNSLSTNGADGGGIILITADQIEGNGNTISSNGNNGPNAGNDGAGGGGAGGSILLNTNSVNSALAISVAGGSGGNATGGHGPSGGGGGGLYWHSGASIPANVTLDATGGMRGLAGGAEYGTSDGIDGGNLGNLMFPGVTTISSATILLTDVDFGSTDNCDIASIDLTQTEFGCDDLGEVMVTMTVTDVNGLMSTCDATITVVELNAPTLSCPGTITMDTDPGECAAVVTFEAMASDDCDDSVDIVYSHNSGDVFPIGTTTVMVTATDDSDNESTCSFDIIVTDGEDPSITCPAPVLQTANAGMCEATGVDLGMATFDDNCPGASVSNDAPASFPVGVTTVTWTVIDAADRETTCTQLVTITDDEDPTITCPAPVTQTADAGLCEATGVDLGMPVFNDNCPGASVSNDAPASFPVGVTTVTWTLIDAADREVTCTQLVTISDDEDPTITCPAPVTQTADAGVCEAASVDLGMPVFDDNCPGATVSNDAPASFSVGVTTVTWTLIDAADREVTCTQMVTITDDEDPAITCPAPVSQSADAGMCEATSVDLGTPVFDDNCPGATVSNDAPASYSIGVTTVTWTVTDATGNEATCEQMVTITDDEDPTVECNDITIDLIDRDTYTLSTADIDAIALGTTDNCPGVTYEVTNGQVEYDCDDRDAQFTVTITATDVAGNTSSCGAIVTIADPNSVCNDPPVAVCMDITISTDETCMASIVASDVDGGSSDPDMDELIYTVDSEGPFGVGIHEVILSVFDGEYTETCTAMVTVEDNTPPNALCQDITIQLDANGDASIVASDVDGGSSDACGITLSVDQTDFDCSHKGENTVVLTVTDDNDNVSTCEAKVTVEDNIEPTAVCQDVSLQLDANGMATLTTDQVDNGSDDNCDMITLSFANTNLLSNGDFEAGSSGWTFMNGGSVINAGNPGKGAYLNAGAGTEVTMSQTGTGFVPGQNYIISGDNKNYANCCGGGGPGPLGVGIDIDGVEIAIIPNPGAAEWNSFSVSFTATASTHEISFRAQIQGTDVDQIVDNLSVVGAVAAGPSIDYTCENVGENTVTLVVSDMSGNQSTCSATITIEDNVPPVAECMDITIQLDANGVASIVASDVDGGSSDACEVTLSVNQTDFDCSHVGANTVELTVTDDNGNVSTCEATVTVEDNVDPIAVCMDITLQLDANGDASIVAADIDGGSSDACGFTLSIVEGSGAFDCSHVGPNTVTLTVTDDNGNVSTCDATVTVEDNVDPIAVCQDITIELDDNGVVSIVAEDIDGGSSDACGVTLSIADGSGDFGCNDVGDHTVTLTITDNNDNVSTCDAIVTVEDNIDPTFSECPEDQNVDSVMGDCSALVTWTIPTVSDNCEVSDPIFTAEGTNILTFGGDALGLFPVGTTTVTMTVTDEHDNEVSCTFDITVNDVEAPIITNCPVDMTVEADPGMCSVDVFYGIITASDNCAGVTLDPISGHMVDGDIFEVGVTEVQFIATDAVGLTTECSFVVTVLDAEDPTIACPGNITQTADAGMCEAANVDLGMPTYADNCPGSTVSNDAPVSYPVGETSVTWTVTDAAGNAVSCEQIVTITDDEDPTIACALDVAVSTDLGACEATGVDLGTPTTDDNCPAAVVTNNAPAFYPVGETTVIWTITDASGNTTSCEQLVTVADNEDPMITCPADVNQTADADVCEAIVTMGSPVTSDNCEVSSVTNDYNGTSDGSDTYPVGTTAVTWTVTDVAGNTVSCEQIVTITDDEDPSITCPADVSQTADAGVCEASSVDLGMATYADNCPGSTVSNNAPTVYPVGTTTVTWTVVDAAGNSVSCEQMVTITDDEAPMIECADDVSMTADAGVCEANVMVMPPNFSDNCESGSGGNALNFDGVNDNVSIADGFPSMTEFTYETWLYPEAISNWDVIMNFDGWTTGYIHFQFFPNGLLEFSVNGNSPTDQFTTQTFSNNEWYHLAVVYSSTDKYIKFYVNGDLVDTKLYSTAIATAPNIPVRIGSWNGSSRFFDGDFDDIRVWDYARTAAEIQLSMVSTLDGSEAGLLAYYNFDDGVSCADNTGSNVATDLATAAGGGNGMLNNFALDGSQTCQSNWKGGAPISPLTLTNDYTGTNDASGIYPVGSTDVVWTVTDEAGNSSSCTQTIVVEDNEDPMITCPADVNQTADAGVCEAIVTMQSPVTSDNCEVSSVTNDYNGTSDGSDTYPVGTTTVTWTVTDIHGNSFMCTHQVVITDDEAPVADIASLPDAVGECDAIVSPPTASDNCSGSIIGMTNDPISYTEQGTYEITWTYTDEYGNTSMQTQTVIVDDTTPPNAVCQDITIELDEDGKASIVASDVDNGSDDNCTPVSLLIDQLDFNCSHVGDNTITLTVTDENGNVSTCDATVMVEDNVDPIAVCQDITIELDDSGVASIVAADIDGGSSDACGVTLSITDGSGDFGCDDIGANTVTLTVTDDNGNMSTCDATVTVEDNVDPIAVCQDITIELDDSGVASIVAADIDGGSSDACGFTLSISQTEFDCSDVSSGTSNSTALNFDGSSHVNLGTSVMPSGSYTKEAWIYAKSNSCKNIFSASNGHQFWLQGNLRAGHAGSYSIVSEGSSFPLNSWQHVAVSYDAGTNMMKLYRNGVLVDSATTGVQQITTINTQIGSHGGCDFFGEMDEVRLWNVARTQIEIQNAMSSTLAGTETGLVGYYPLEDGTGSTIASDASGNGNDGTLSGINPAIDWITSTAPIAGSSGPTVTLTVTDSNGNMSTCEASVTVEDNVAPIAVCQDITIELDDVGAASIVAADIDGGSSDACGVTLSIAEGSGDFGCDDVGDNTVTLTVTDDNGNVSTCDATVTVEDNVDPIAVCQNISIELDDSGTASIVASDIDGGSSDACGVTLSIAAGSGDFGCDNVGDNTVTLSVTDDNGNVSTCDATVTVEDNVNPVAVCQDITIELDDSGAASIVATDIDGGSSDACGVTLSIIEGSGDFGCADVGMNTVTLTVTDDNGNVSTCDATVTVEDNVDPIAICQDITIELDDSGVASIVAADIDGGSNDACGVTLSISEGSVDFGCDDVGANTVTLTVTDDNGNVSTCDATVTVEDNVDPVAVCQDILVILDETGNITITASDVDGGSSDACGITLSIDEATFDCSHVGPNTVVLTVTDSNGNASSCTSTVTIAGMDADEDGFSICEGDCDDNDDTIYPDAPELCDGKDNDCNGSVDEPTENSTEYEWIESVEVQDLNNVSGNDGGYGNYCDMTLNVSTGESYTMTLTPGYAGQAYHEAWSVYIDYNQNGEFEHPEELAASDFGKWTQYTSLSIPQDAMTGTTKMRVIMSYEWAMEPCADGYEGEVEDYTIIINACDNLDDGGEIAEDESVCPANDDPSEIYSVSAPSGGSGVIEYLWMQNTVSGTPPTTNMANWEVIPGANGASYDPGPLTETTWYIRCARRAGCTVYTGESNVVRKRFNSNCSEYCDSYGESTTYEWIEAVEFGDIDNVSGNDGGYGDYTSMTTNLVSGEATHITLTPGFAGQAYKEYWKIWIDYNQDGDFDPNLELAGYASSSGAISGFINVPNNALSGPTTMRISMKYGAYPHPCEIFGEGEVEDYTVVVSICDNLTDGGEIGDDEVLCEDANDPSEIYSVVDPSGGSGDIEYMWLQSTTTDVPPAIGGLSDWNEIVGANGASYDPGSISETTWYIRCARRSGCTEFLAESNVVEKTYNNSCTAYCESYGETTSDEWIQRVICEDIYNNSGNNGGYADFTDQSTALGQGDSHTVKLKPGFSGSKYREYWRVWIDWNQDGVFDHDTELAAQGNSKNQITRTIHVPGDAELGETTMRVSMKYNAYAMPCEVFSYGEVEDYTIEVVTETSSIDNDTEEGMQTEIESEARTIEALEVQVYPNPVTDIMNVQVSGISEAYVISIMDGLGKVVWTRTYESEAQAITINAIELGLSSGSYNVVLRSNNHQMTKRILVVR